MTSSQPFIKAMAAWDSDRIRELLPEIMRNFKSGGCAASSFSNREEVIKAERGYNTDLIPRSTSIAAHALLSTEVFVVLDTKKVCSNHDCVPSCKLSYNRTGVFTKTLS